MILDIFACYTTITPTSNEMRQVSQEQSRKITHEMVSKLEKRHTEFIDNYYGSDNKLRLTGDCETGDYNTFTCYEGGRGGSIRIPTSGNYFEDRRPASNINPYLACSKLMDCVLET